MATENTSRSFVGLDPLTHTAAVFSSPEGTWRLFHLSENPRFPALFTKSTAAVLVGVDQMASAKVLADRIAPVIPLAGVVPSSVAIASCFFPVDSKARLVIRIGSDVDVAVCRNGDVLETDTDYILRGSRHLHLAQRIDAKVGLCIGCEHPEVELLASAESLMRARLLFGRHPGKVGEVLLDNGLRVSPSHWETVWETDKDSQLRLTKLCDLVITFAAAKDLAGVIVTGQLAKLLADATIKRHFPLQTVVAIEGLRADFAGAVGAAILAARSHGVACSDTIDYSVTVVESMPDLK